MACLRIVLEMDGEVITKASPDVGYLHRGDEKIAENMTYNQFVPYTDRLDYLAPLANNVAYACAVEKLMGWTLPPVGRRSASSAASWRASPLTCSASAPSPWIRAR
jgi:NADH-quinone oxidoreductase subunit D